MNGNEPESMNDVVYFSRRTLEPKGRATAWACKVSCPKCKNALMGKPIEKGKIRIRAEEYVCPSCGYTEEKLEHEKKLTIAVKYTCPHCDKEGFSEGPYKRKTYMGASSYLVDCEHCGGKIAITKRMKEPKKKGAKAMPLLDDD
jgi:predicted RNA-binding Zn-ribbon protein involved in translation (DUF1610 family)